MIHGVHNRFMEQKQKYKILISNLNKENKITYTLYEVNGVEIDDYVFIYYDKQHKQWCITEKHTGMKICCAKTNKEVVKIYNDDYKSKMLNCLKSNKLKDAVIKFSPLYKGKVNNIIDNVDNVCKSGL